MVIKNKTKLKEDLPTVESTTRDIEPHSPETIIDTPTIKNAISREENYVNNT